MMDSEIEIWASEYELRQFIDLATRWKISAAHRTSERQPFGIFTGYVSGARNNFETFSKQLNKKLTESQNWKAIEIDLKDRFLPMIAQYIDWYNGNKTEIDTHDPNAYELMLSVLESTKKEIIKYFPEINGAQQQQKDNCGMKKCKRYPDCKCFNNYEKDAIEIDADNSWLFVSCIKELEHALLGLEWIEFDNSIALILPYFDVIPGKLHVLFAAKVYIMMEAEMKWKMPAPTLTLKRISNSLNEAVVRTVQGFNVEGYMAKKMVEINNAQKEKQATRELHRQEMYNKLVGDKIRSPHIADFKEKAEIENSDKSNPYQYLKFLRSEKESYTNAILYLNIYGSNEIDATAHDFYTEILAFINTEIAERLGKNKVIDSPAISPPITKLKAEFAKYGFYELQLVKNLPETGKEKLLSLIADNKLPYKIAMLHYLGFITHLEQAHFPIKDNLNKELAKWFNADKTGRTVKGNISSMQPKSNDNKNRYTAHTHNDTIKKEYQNLKQGL